MSDLFTRFQRLLDRARDGEAVRAPELAAVAPLFVSAPAADLDGLTAQIGALPRPGRRLPLGEVVLGPAGAAGVSWPVAELGLAAALADVAVAVVLAERAREVLGPSELDALAGRLGLDPQDLARAAETCVRASAAEVTPVLPEGAWSLVVTAGVPVVEVVSPYVRDVAASIDGFAADRGLRIRDDDDRYRLLPLLMEQDPRLSEERALAEASCGITTRGRGMQVIQPRELDLAAVDTRVRNALTSLRRQGESVVVAPAVRASVELALGAAVPPRRVMVVAEVDTAAAEVVVPRWIRHVAGHALAVDPATSEAMCASLPRERSVAEIPQLVTFPARVRLREEVRDALVGEAGAVDSGAYPALLALTLAEPPWADPGVPSARRGSAERELSCAGAIPTAAGELALAVWRLCGTATWRPARGRSPLRR